METAGFLWGYDQHPRDVQGSTDPSDTTPVSQKTSNLPHSNSMDTET